MTVSAFEPTGLGGCVSILGRTVIASVFCEAISSMREIALLRTSQPQTTLLAMTRPQTEMHPIWESKDVW